MKNSQKGFVVPLLIVIVVLVIGGGVYYFSRKVSTYPINKIQSSVSDQTGITNSSLPTDNDLKVSHTRIPESNNSASTWNSISATTIVKSDRDFLSKYLGNYSSKNLPPLGQSISMTTKYQNLLNIFDSVAQKEYQCSIALGEICPLGTIRDVSELAALRATVLLQQQKLSDAKSTAENVVLVGKQITANADDIIYLLVGWASQKLGYGILNTIHQKQGGTYLTSDAKEKLVSILRQEHKKVLQFMYTGYANMVNYISSPNNKPADMVLDPDGEEQIGTYRKEIAKSPNALNPTKTKKFFYDSFKIAIANVTLPCGTTSASSTINVGFNIENTQDENYIGKKIYTTLYPASDSLSQKRCEVENLIQSL